ncbi:MAG: ABC transporter permease [Geobacteraceae bacterium]|nr:ABC transporter permease [Geobacteraceae bacterium]
MTENSQTEVLQIIRPVSGWFDLHLTDLWRYRDLIMLFVRRDFVAVYKQTILGPLWYLLQPIMTTIVFTFVFGNIAKIPTDGVPPTLFYFAGLTVWSYFSGCLNRTSNTFVNNAGIFGKVYFPRLSVPLSVVISGLIGFFIQMTLFIAILIFYNFQGAVIGFNPLYILALPLLILQIAALGLGFGIIVSSLTTKYRDLVQLVGFGVQLWMYATPIAYPSSQVPDRWQWVIALNPMTPVVEMFRFTFLGVGTINLWQIGQSLMATVIILFIGIILFSRVEKNFMDTV